MLGNGVQEESLGACQGAWGQGSEQRGAPGLPAPSVDPPLASPLHEELLDVASRTSTLLGWRELRLSPSSGAGEVSLRWEQGHVLSRGEMGEASGLTEGEGHGLAA